MRRILPLLFIAALMLGGCAVVPAAPSQPEGPTTTAPSVTTAVTTAQTTASATQETTTAVPVTGQTTAVPTTVTTTTAAPKPTTATKKPLSVDEIYKSLKRADRDCEEYDLDKYMSP